MPNKKAISEEIKNQVKEIVEKFNKKELSSKDVNYYFKFRGKFVYFFLGNNLEDTLPMFRLEYLGDIRHWKFVVYLYSSEKYDPKEDCFPGSNILDGTLEKSLEAGIILYYY